MICAAIIVWFLCGIAGVHLGRSLSDPHDALSDLPRLVWLVAFGPAILITAIFFAVLSATKKAGK